MFTMQSTLELLFPTAVMVVDIDQQFSLEHDQLINEDYHQTADAQAQFEQTKNTYVLNSYPGLATWLTERVNDYAQQVMATTDRLRLTQSWCLKHQGAGQQLYTHSHPNSIVSGAYYVAADQNSQRLRFHRNMSNTTAHIKWSVDAQQQEAKPWTWDWQEIPAQTGRLVLFPSNTLHSVEYLENTELRCVLSFNTWFDGAFGQAEKLFELK
jgi:uncharacterized protein (TIGR02466 family)